MKKVALVFYCAVLLLAFGTTSALAASSKLKPQKVQPRVEEGGLQFGVQAGYGADSDLGIGVRVEYPLESIMQNMSVAGSFNYFLPGSDVTWWELNCDAHFQVPVADLKTYVGVGVNYSKMSFSFFGITISDSQAGVNLLVGSKFNKINSLTPFVEAKFELSGGEQFVLAAGVLF